jgi:pseudouridine-5'-phosphate glycosidase
LSCLLRKDTQTRGNAQEGKYLLINNYRDFAYVMAKKGNGSTTVAGTMYLSSLAGIKVFVTGGIGGVHRGAE